MQKKYCQKEWSRHPFINIIPLKKLFKHFLKRVGVYYQMQGSYRAAIDHFNKIYSRTKFKKFRGSGYSCNACGEMYSRFIPGIAEGNIVKPLEKYQVIAGYGENVFCPNCFSTSRDRLVLAVLQDRFSIHGLDILHMSPEAAISMYLKNHAKVISTDIEPECYKRIDKNTIYADVTSLPFTDATFDMIIANHILEHIPDDDKAMRELKRVLKPG